MKKTRVLLPVIFFKSRVFIFLIITSIVYAYGFIPESPEKESGAPFLLNSYYWQSPLSSTVIIDSAGDGGFESGSAFSDNGWTVVNGTYNRFYLGDAPGGVTGNRCAFTAQTSSSWSGSSNNAVNHFYRDVNFPAGESVIFLHFRYKVTSSSGTNNLKSFHSSHFHYSGCGDRIKLGADWQQLQFFNIMARYNY